MKSEAGSNYDDTSKKWLERVNKEGNKNTLRAKPNKDAWLDQGHDAWDAYKLWAQGPATRDATVIAAVRPHLPVAHPTEAKYKATALANDNFKKWFNAQDDSVKDSILFEGFKTTSDYTTDKAAWISTKANKDRWIQKINDPLEVEAFRLNNLFPKIQGSKNLYELFKNYRNAKIDKGNRKPDQIYIQDLRSLGNTEVSKIFNNLLQDLTSTNPITQQAALAFKNAYINNYDENHSIPLVGQQNNIYEWSLWKANWYDLNKSDLKWDDWDSRFYYLTTKRKVPIATTLQYINDTYKTYREKEDLFDSSPYGSSWILNNLNPDPKTKEAMVLAGFRQTIFTWATQLGWSDTSKGTAPQYFLDWRDGLNGEPTYKPIYADRQKYKDYVSKLGDDGKKAFAWDEYFKSDTGKAEYDAWVKAQGAVQITEDDYKATATADTKATTWFNKQDTATKDGYYQEGFIASDKYPVDKSAWIQSKDTREAWGALTPALQKKVAQKLGTSNALYNIFYVYRGLYAMEEGISESNKQLYIKDLRDNVVKTNGIVSVFRNLYADISKTGVRPSRKQRAIEFRDSFMNDNEKFNAHLATSHIWQEDWYDMKKSDLKWNDWKSRFYWITSQNISKNKIMSDVVSPYYTAFPQQTKTKFRNSRYGSTWDLNNPSGDENAEIANGLAQKDAWLIQLVLNDTTRGSAPADFTTWVNNFSGPLYKTRSAYSDYVTNLKDSDKKELVWDDYIKHADGIKDFDDWKKTSPVSPVHVTAELLKKYDTYKNLYKASTVSATDYSKWSPWYIKDNNDYDMYVQNGLDLEASTPITNSLYLRYVAARYKEHDAFHVGNAYQPMKNWLWGWGSKKIPLANINGIFRHPNMKLDATLAEQEEADKSATDKPEYRGGYSEKEAYQKDKTDFKDLDQADQNAISEDIMENRKDIFLDIATRYNKYHLKNVGASGKRVSKYWILIYQKMINWIFQFLT